jgi:catechol 2,3-dioxygenase-like lactoylglutathione lyase family enzyme
MAKKNKKAAKKAPAKKAKAAAKKVTPKKAAPKRAAARKTTAKTKASAPAVKKAPAAHASVAPGITANDAAASIQWYCDVLGFTLAEKWEIEGVFRGGSVRSGNVQINIGQDDWKAGRDRIKGQGTRFYVQTGLNIDKYVADIKSRGGVLEQEPADHWGTRTFSIADPDGFKFTFMNPRKG